MILKLHTPDPPLSSFIELFTFHQGYSPAHSIERLLPEGAVDLVIDLTDDPKYIFDNYRLSIIQSCRGAWVSGTRSHFISISAGHNSTMFVVRVCRGMAYPIIRVPIAELQGRVVPADEIFGSMIYSLRQRLLDEATPERKFAAATSFFMDRLKSANEVPGALQQAVTVIARSPGEKTIAQVADESGYSHKHMVSLFKKHVGLSPLSFLRTMKFQQAISRIETLQEVNWLDIAHQSGYYDQAHFINDFKSFCGFTPGEYLAAKGETLNYIPIA